MRYKEERRIIAPATIDVIHRSQDATMQRSNEWFEHAKNNRDHIWLEKEELRAMANETKFLTTNTATIVNFYFNEQMANASSSETI